MEQSFRKDAWIWPVVVAGHAAVFAAVLSIGVVATKSAVVPVVNVALVVDEVERTQETKPQPMPETMLEKVVTKTLAEPATKPTVAKPAPTATPVAAVKGAKAEAPLTPVSGQTEKVARIDARFSESGMSGAVAPSDKPAVEAADAKAAKVAEASAAPRKVSALAYLRAPQPQYPAVSRRMNEQGKAVLKVMVDEAGRVMEMQIQTSSGFARLDEAAKRAVQAAVFRPYVENGHPLKAWAYVPISFGLVEGGNNE